MNQLLGNALVESPSGILNLLSLLSTYAPRHFSDPNSPNIQAFQVFFCPINKEIKVFVVALFKIGLMNST